MLDCQRKPLFADPAIDVTDQIIVGESHPARQRLPDGHPPKLDGAQQNFDARHQLRCDQHADPPDSPTESFWATLRVEFYDRYLWPTKAAAKLAVGDWIDESITDADATRYLWPTKAAAKLAVGDWIERVYNRNRRHSTIGMISPVDFEDRLTQTAQAA